MSYLPKYFEEVSQDMLHQHERIRKDYITHNLSAGQNRENYLADFLRKHLPSAFGIDTGLITAHNGEFSNEADLVIYDQIWNTCLHPELPKKVFLIESVYGLIEVKTQLNRRDIQDAVEKCRKFKRLPRQYCDFPIPRITDSIFILWAFESPEPQTVKSNLYSVIKDIPNEESPDFIVVPGRFLVKGGSYHSLVKWIQRIETAQSLTPDPRATIENEMMKFLCIEESLFVWFFYMTSWLRYAGNRCPDIESYLGDPNKIWGKIL